MRKIVVILFFVFSFSIPSVAQSDERESVDNCRIDSFGRIDKSRLFARLEPIYTELKYDSTAEAVISIEFNKNDNRNKKKALLKMFNQYFDLRKSDRSRFTFLISEANDELTTLSVVFNWNESKSENFDNRKLVLKGENLKQAINSFFKKN